MPSLILYEKIKRLHLNGSNGTALKLLQSLPQPMPVQFELLYGVVLRSVKKFTASEAVYRRLLMHEGLQDGILLNLANVLIDMGRCDEAVDTLLQLDKPDAHSQRTLGLAYFYGNQFARAEECFRRLLLSDPLSPDLQWHLALTLLSQHSYPEAWDYYESRKLLPGYGKRFEDVHWQDASELSSQSRVLVYTEQGFGDNIQFSRFLPRLLATGAEVTVVVRPELERLFSTIDGIRVRLQADPSEFSHVVSLLSLPYLFRIKQSDISALSGVFNIAVADVPSRDQGKIVVGIVWSGKMSPRDRSIPLEWLDFLFQDIRYQVVCLQVDSRVEDLKSIYAERYVHTPVIKDFYDSARVMLGLDLMISIDSAPLHLAGMLGVPAIGLLLYHSDWRWQRLEGELPWYPAMQLLEQEEANSWIGIRNKLKRHVVGMFGGEMADPDFSEPALLEITSASAE